MTCSSDDKGLYTKGCTFYGPQGNRNVGRFSEQWFISLINLKYLYDNNFTMNIRLTKSEQKFTPPGRKEEGKPI